MKFKPGDKVRCIQKGDWGPCTPSPGDVLTVDRSSVCEGCGEPILTFREAHFVYGNFEGGFHEAHFEKVLVN